MNLSHPKSCSSRRVTSQARGPSRREEENNNVHTQNRDQKVNMLSNNEWFYTNLIDTNSLLEQEK